MATLSCPSPNPKEEGSSNVASQPVSVGCVCPECSIFNVYRRIGEKQVKVGMFTRTSKCEVCHSVLHWKRAVVMENGKPNGSTVEITEHNPRRTHQQATRLQMLKSAYAQANFVWTSKLRKFRFNSNKVSSKPSLQGKSSNYNFAPHCLLGERSTLVGRPRLPQGVFLLQILTPLSLHLGEGQLSPESGVRCVIIPPWTKLRNLGESEIFLWLALAGQIWRAKQCGARWLCTKQVWRKRFSF